MVWRPITASASPVAAGPPAQTSQTPSVLGPIDTGPLVIGGITPARGRATLTLHRDGTCQLAGSFTNYGPSKLDIAVVIVVHTSTGHDHPFSQGVALNGSAGGGSTTATWDVTSKNPGIAADWAQIAVGGTFDADASAGLDAPALLARILAALIGAI